MHLFGFYYKNDIWMCVLLRTAYRSKPKHATRQVQVLFRIFMFLSPVSFFFFGLVLVGSLKFYYMLFSVKILNSPHFLFLVSFR
jgi:hypothetical protein